MAVKTTAMFASRRRADLPGYATNTACASLSLFWGYSVSLLYWYIYFLLDVLKVICFERASTERAAVLQLRNLVHTLHSYSHAHVHIEPQRDLLNLDPL